MGLAGILREHTVIGRYQCNGRVQQRRRLFNVAHTPQGLSAKDYSVSAKRVHSRKRRRDEHESCSTEKVRSNTVMLLISIVKKVVCIGSK